MRIVELIVSGSDFYGEKLHIKFSSKLNCIMGGRGSGKTTVLMLIHWALSSEDAVSRDLLNLVKANLGSGALELVLEDIQSNTYRLTKEFGTGATIQTGRGEAISLEDLRRRFEIDHFTAGSIEKIGMDPRERLRIFDRYIGQPIQDVKTQLNLLVSELERNDIQLESALREKKHIEEEMHSFLDLDADALAAKAELAAVESDSSIKEEYEAETKKQAIRTIEQNFFSRAKDQINLIASGSTDYANVVRGAQTVLQTAEFANPHAQEFRGRLLEALANIDSQIASIRSGLTGIAEDLEESRSAMRSHHLVAESVFSEIKKQIEKHRDVFQRLNVVTQKETARQIALDKAAKVETRITTLREERTKNLTAMRKSTAERGSIRRKSALEINERLGGKVKILIAECSLSKPFEDLLRTVVSDANMRMATTEAKILEKSQPIEFLNFLSNDDVDGYAEKLGADRARVRELFKAFRDQRAIHSLEICVCEDAPNFYLAVEDGERHESFKPTEELSMGQRCTAVLPVVFAVTSNPLLIDQPEDNLDNRYIVRSVQQIIHDIKSSRQLIFVTHNPNIPVISDSEFNLFLEFSDGVSRVTSSGNVGAVKQEIVGLLEGGQDAFNKRKEFYGY
ncbi:MAG: hypothetical protein EOP06_00055 [Proteobacteria bacterium]|nr:MAG: hypothetical protein EOP06_00055 [Pseudomonadota bacterium]